MSHHITYVASDRQTHTTSGKTSKMRDASFAYYNSLTISYQGVIVEDHFLQKDLMTSLAYKYMRYFNRVHAMHFLMI